MRSNGSVQDVRLPLARRPAGPVPDHARHRRPRRALRAAPLERAPARRGGPPALPGREDRDRAADRAGLLLRLRVPGADRARPTSSGSRTRCERELAEGRTLVARGDLARRGARAVRGRGRAVQGRARRHRRGRHLALHPVPRRRDDFTDLCRGPHLQDSLADQGVQAHGPRRRLLARRRAQHAADADLRHRVLPPGRPRRAPRAARGGAQARPPPARRRSSTCSTSPTSRRARRSGTRRGWRSGTCSRTCAAARTAPAATSRCARRRSTTRSSGSPRATGRSTASTCSSFESENRAVRAEADELPGPLRALRRRRLQLPRAAAAHGRGRRRCTATS